MGYSLIIFTNLILWIKLNKEHGTESIHIYVFRDYFLFNLVPI